MRRPAVLAAAVAAALAGCGNDRTPVPDTTPDAPRGVRVLEVGGAGLRVRTPLNWALLAPQGARAAGIRSKGAIVAIWRYDRAEPLPRTEAEFEQARDRLLERAKQRGFTPGKAALVRRAGTRAIELTGSESIGGVRVRVRSAHLFAGRGEIVVDAYAPPEHFPRLDRTVFRPLLASLRLTRR